MSDHPSAGLLSDSMRLRVLVFACGASLMAWEIAGSRVLGPDFGSTIYVWGSLIGVIMAALSGGYYLGGILADRRPSLNVLCGIVAAAGLVLLVDRVIAAGVCRAVVGRFGPRLEPLIASVVLFLPASVLLGMVSPFAVRLEARSVGTTGSTAGMLYALSTFGSIVGTMATSFWLLETFRVTTIILMLGAVLIAAAAYAWLPRYLRRQASLSTSLIVAALALGASVFVPASAFSVPIEGEIVAELESPYQHIVVLDQHYGGRVQRRLIFDRYVQSAVYPDSNFDSATTYTQLFYLPFIFEREIRQVLIIGLGGGVGPRMFHKYDGVHIDSVEIDPKVVRAAELYFGFTQTERMPVHVGDGRVFVRQTPKTYDLVILDAYSVGARVPFHLLTREFYEEILAKLNPGGVVYSNIISAIEGRNSRLYRATLKTFNAAFGRQNVYVFRKRPPYAYTPDTDSNNTALIALPSQGRRMGRDEIEQRASRLVDSGLIHEPHFVHHARQFVAQSLETRLDDVPVLTDDFAPVDLMTVPN